MTDDSYGRGYQTIGKIHIENRHILSGSVL